MEKFKEFTKKIVSHYGKELSAVLVYGSRVSNLSAVDVFSDYDITVVFAEYPSHSLPVLHPLADVTMVFLNEVNLIGVHNFRLDGHGPFYLHALANATALYGQNPFPEYAKEIDPLLLRNSLKDQIVAHCWKLQKICLTNDTRRRSREIRKYTFRIAQNYHFLQHGIDYELFRCKSYEQWVDKICRKPNAHQSLLKYLESAAISPDILSVRQVLEFCGYIKNKTTDVL